MTNSRLLGPLTDAIETARRQMLERRRDLTGNETRTRNAQIDPILRALDWNVSNPSQVTTEYELPSGRVDYALRGQNSRVLAIIEAKRLGESLERHRGQLIHYAYESQPVFAVLTNGDVWELYDVEATDSDFRFVRLAIISLSENEPIQSARALLSIWQLNLAGEQLDESASVEQEQPSPEGTATARKERQREAGRKAAAIRRQSGMSQDERNKAMYADRPSGMTYREIAKKYGFSENGGGVHAVIKKMERSLNEGR